ncbi:MAG: hypothetical protein IJZ87_03080, partial [Bacteroidales bacterium]|nr:hypothetical protein [Bacteroidales bacterium]
MPSTSSGTCTDPLNVSTHIICNKDVCDTSPRGDSVSLAKSQSTAEISCQDSALLCDSARFLNLSISQIIRLSDSILR